MAKFLLGSAMCRALAPARPTAPPRWTLCTYREVDLFRATPDAGQPVRIQGVGKAQMFKAIHSDRVLLSELWHPSADGTLKPNSVTQLRVRSLSLSKRLARKAGNTGHAKRSTKKKRLDELCVERYPQYSRSLIQSWILQGKVLVDGKPADKAGTSVSESQDINLIAEVPKYVCRAGYKLEAALEHFAADVQGKVALDAGLSTGGFSDCLLQNGASLIYGVDVGYGQVAEKIRTDPRMVVMERTNLRLLPVLPTLVDLATLDLSFISILLVLPAVLASMKPDATLFTLIKPQFEARRNQVGGGGIVRDAEVHKEVLNRVINGVELVGLKCEGWIQSPLKGADGNIEFLACFHRGKGGTISQPASNKEINAQEIGPVAHDVITTLAVNRNCGEALKEQ